MWSQFSNCIYRIMPAGCKMSDIRGGADAVRKSLESIQDVFRALIRELLAFEIMVMDSKRQLLLGKALVDSIQDAAGGIAGNIARAEDFGEPDSVFEVRVFFDGGRVIRDAAYSCLIEFCPSRMKQVVRGMVHQHELP